MTSQQGAQDFFRVGGTLAPDVPSYVVREADDELQRLVLAGHFCYVLTARQMGKSSLMIRTAKRLQAEGVRTAAVELTQIGTQGGVEAWYLSLLNQIHGQLGLVVDYQRWWNARAGLSPVQRFSDFLRQVGLEEISDRVVIFIDEIDTTLKLDFSDDFFAAIRAVYNARASDPDYERLTFVLLGVAMPGDLIQDRTRTPFNIGQRVQLQEFSPREGNVLQEGLEAAYPEEGGAIFARIYHWTGGHPYLAQKLCAAAAQSEDGPWTEERVDVLVEENFFTEEASRKESNLQFIRDRIQASPDKRQLLRLYRQVREGKEVPDEERSAVKSRLKLYGLVKATPRGTLAVRNRIYEQVFDLEWVKEAMPKELTRWVIATSLLVALVAVAVAGYLYIRQRQQTADFYISQFRASSSADVRITSLAGLMEISGYEDVAQRLFFEDLTPYERLALFRASDPEALQEELVTVVKALYSKMDNTSEGNAILQEMASSLLEVDDPEARNLATEIQQWLKGRDYASQGQYNEAITAYGIAVDLKDDNPGTRFERGTIYANLKNYSDALEDLNRSIELDNSRAETIDQVIRSSPGLYHAFMDNLDNYQSLQAVVPTPTASPTPTMTPTPQAAPPVGRILFSDEFDNHRLSWSTGGGGGWEVTDNQLKVRAEPWGTRRLKYWQTRVEGGPNVDTVNLEQVTLQVEARVPNTDLPAGAGIVFGYKRSGEYYGFVVLNPSGGPPPYSTWKVVKSERGAENLDTINEALLSPRISERFTLRIDLQRDESMPGRISWVAHCYVNDAKVGTTALSDYVGGRVGLVTIGPLYQEGAVLFDNFLAADFIVSP